LVGKIITTITPQKMEIQNLGQLINCTEDISSDKALENINGMREANYIKTAPQI
jgi:hypothetical protein